MPLTQDKVAELHRKLDKALEQFAEENGLVAGQFRITYSSNAFTCVKLSFTTKESNPDAIDPRFLIDIKRNGWKYGLDESMIGKTFMSGKLGQMKLLGMRASKAIAAAPDGKNYSYDAADVAFRITGKR